jgi:hypothetical protein
VSILIAAEACADLSEYALEQLATREELEVFRQRHAAFFVTLAEAGVRHQCLEIAYPTESPRRSSGCGETVTSHCKSRTSRTSLG